MKSFNSEYNDINVQENLITKTEKIKKKRTVKSIKI